MMLDKLALSGRLFEKDYKDNIPFKEFCEIASKIGYQGVELRKTQVSLETPERKVKEYVKIIKDFGLEVVCMTPRGYPVLEDENFFIQYLELAKKFNCQILKMGGDPKKTRKCSEIAQKYSIKIGLNNHIGKEDNPGVTETIDRTINYLSKVNHPNFGILYDPSHLFVSGSDYGPEAICKIKDKIFYVLVQYPVKTDKENAKFKFYGCYFKESIIGEPNGPEFRKVFKGLKEIDYRGHIGVIASMPKDKDPKEVAKIYYEKIKQIFAEVE